MSVKRHTGYNLVGAAIPIALSLVTIPIYLKLVGVERYGVLSIAWLLLGYFGLFDLGLGRAVSFRIAALRDAAAQERADTFWAALLVNLIMGFVGAAVLWLAAGLFFGEGLKVSEALRNEVSAAVPLLALSLPVATATGVLTGALQGRERFLEINLVSVLSTALFQLLPLLVAWRIGPNLGLLLASALTARLLGGVALALLCRREVTRGCERRLRQGEVPALLKYGGWVSLTSMVGPFLVFVDRFVIGFVLGAAPVAIYSVAVQLARQITVVPIAMTTALFPRMSAADDNDRDATSKRTTIAMASLLSLPVLCAIVAIQPFMDLWVGGDMASKAAPVGRILLIAFWLNAFAMIAYTKLQASGRPDLVTKMLLVEIPLYLAALYLGLHFLGLPGSALAFAARCGLDYVLLTWVGGRTFESLHLLAANFGLLLLSAVAATVWPVTDWRLWLATGVLGGAAAAFGWWSLPVPMRDDLIRRLRTLQIRNPA